MAKLGELGKIITGNTPKTSDAQNYRSNDICFVKPSDFTDNEITEIHQSEFYISEYAKDKARVLPTDSILVTCIGIIGKVAINKVPCAFNQQINAIIPERKICGPRYVAYAIQNVQPQMQNTANAAVVPILNKTQFSNIEISLPSLETQKQIVEFLDKVTSLISLRKQQLAKLDELVKARFVEMFGDPVSNPLHWKKVKLSELADIKIGPFGSLLHKEDYVTGGHPLVNPSHIISGKIIVDNDLTLTEEKYFELSAYHLKKNDVILGRRGEMGRCAVVNEEGLLCGTGSLLIRTNGTVTADYIQKIISFPTFKKTIEDMAVGQTMPNLNVPIVSNFMIIVPPLSVQKDYYDFVECVDQQKQTVQQSLEKLELMKKALMQEYFG